MYLLDTNVISELRKAAAGKADKNVMAWAKSVPAAALFLSVISILELEVGVLQAERRDPHKGVILRSWLGEDILPAFEGRILSVDTPIVRRCATLHVPNSRPERDAIIAATALVHGMTVATRNIRHFEACGAEILNPWEA